jgi:hypothetical protein
MITIAYLNSVLPDLGYELQQDENEGVTVFWKKIEHNNVKEKMAFTVIFITLDTYTITIEGMNEMLVRRAVKAGAVELESLQTLILLRDVIYDTTLDTSIKDFETIFNFFEAQVVYLPTTDFESDEYELAIKNIRILVDAANMTPLG